MSTETCLVTVIIPVFNSASTLRRAVGSVLRQRISSFDVIIVDDGSRDASLSEAHLLAARDRRIQVVALPENRGKPHAMNRAIEAARGDWIAVLDADDWYDENRLASLVAAGERHRADMIADNQYFHDAGAGTLVGTAFSPDRGDTPLSRQDFIAGSDTFADFNFGMLKPVVRAGFVRRTGLRYRENARLGEDFLYLVEFFAAGGTAFLVSRPMYYWTQAFGRLSRRWTETGAGAWRYDFLAARTANADVRDDPLMSTHADLIALLTRRDRALLRLHWLREFSLLGAEGHGFAKQAALIARHPSLWPSILRRKVCAVLACGARPSGDGAPGPRDATPSGLTPCAARRLDGAVT